MKKLLLSAFALFSFTFISTSFSQGMFEAKALGAGMQINTHVYGVSAKYNFTEKHNAELIIGSSFKDHYDSPVTITGKYLYNFLFQDSFKVYGFAQIGAWIGTKDYYYDDYYDDYYYDYYYDYDRNTAVAFGLGGGIEYALPGFEQLGLCAEVGYASISRSGIDNDSDPFIGIGAHYYFSF